jgi:hypothetical protein
MKIKNDFRNQGGKAIDNVTIYCVDTNNNSETIEFGNTSINDFTPPIKVTLNRNKVAWPDDIEASEEKEDSVKITIPKDEQEKKWKIRQKKECKEFKLEILDSRGSCEPWKRIKNFIFGNCDPDGTTVTIGQPPQ